MGNSRADKPHKKLILWKKSLELVMLIYRVVKDLPREEDFGLNAQMRRAVISVPSNIAEGLTRATKGDKLRFLNIVRASLSELDAQVEVSAMLGYISEQQTLEIDENMTSVEQLLSGLIRSIR
ncbi:MAG: four helix bundle protein [Bacteroidetes bacterium]|nr:four helix bundle protein [Bacteroidota bacterium]